MNFKTLFALLLIAHTVHAAPCMDAKTKMIKDGVPMPDGPKKGLCIDTSLAQPVIRLSPDSITPDSTTMVLKQVMNGGEHGILVIPTHQLRTMILQLERFPPKLIAAHTQIRLQFDREALRWYRNEQSLRLGIPDAFLSDLVLSVEAIGVEGYTYNIFGGSGVNEKNFLQKGLKGEYALVYRAVALVDKTKSMVEIAGNTVEQYELRLGQLDAIAFLRHFVDRSEKVALSSLYHTLKTNCTNELLRTIQSIPGHQRSFRDTNLNFFLPVFSAKLMKRYGYIDKRLKNLNDEVCNLIL